ncbi:MAG TPA: helix-turn-helix transcriptional regulator [Catenuloplanes sp.]|jgi:transcriptional regulator with XRE-family HTH domain
MSPDAPDHAARAGTTIGPLLTRLRLARGFSQLRVAEQLCAAAGLPTVTRHEVSRWEREERIPGPFWIAWLAMVLDAPVEQLSTAAALTRARGSSTVEPGRGGHPGELAQLAHVWLAGSADPPAGGHDDVRRLADQLSTLGGRLARVAGPPVRPTPHRVELDRFGSPRGGQPPRRAVELSDLRRLDDLVGGIDLAGAVGRQLVDTARRVAAPRRWGPARRLAQIADAAQFAGWVAADAGDRQTAVAGYRLAVVAATAAGDRPLGAYAIASASHLLVEYGDAPQALLLARTAYSGGHRTSSATGRAVLLHRVALAAALAGQRAVAERALGAAERVAAQAEPSRDPAWLYWAGAAQLRSMSGRCLAALGRPLRAEPLLRAGPHTAAGPREAALAGADLAGTYLDLGEIEQACSAAGVALLDAVRAGSARAAARVAAVTDRLSRFADLPPARAHLRCSRAARPYLPVTEPVPAARRGNA